MRDSKGRHILWYDVDMMEVGETEERTWRQTKCGVFDKDRSFGIIQIDVDA